jgi:TPP-dependent pyruvate/acetoin dehydrogenase alpha subunit
VSRSTAAQAASTADRGEALELYRRMLLIRRFEDTVQSLFQKGEVHGTTHLYSGQEAVAARQDPPAGDKSKPVHPYPSSMPIRPQ